MEPATTMPVEDLPPTMTLAYWQSQVQLVYVVKYDY